MQSGITKHVGARRPTALSLPVQLAFLGNNNHRQVSISTFSFPPNKATIWYKEKYSSPE